MPDAADELDVMKGEAKGAEHFHVTIAFRMIYSIYCEPDQKQGTTDIGHRPRMGSERTDDFW